MDKSQIEKNDLQSMFPHIAKEWHPIKNGDLTPSDVHNGSSKKIWWLCPNGHEYQKTVAHRTKHNQGCPICRLQKRSFASVHPELLKFWDYDKNTNILPNEIFYGSDNKVWWKCEKGHSYLQKVCSKSSGAGCPICTNQIINSENSLGSNFPIIAEEWHPTKNGNLTPYDIAPYSHKKVWWICKNGHEYQQPVYTHHTSGCPICDAEKRTSFPEQAILFYLGKLFTAFGRMSIGGVEADVYCPSINLVVEYDGEYYHQGLKNDKREKSKNTFFSDKNITLIRIKETKKDISFNITSTEYGYLIKTKYSQTYLFLEEVILTILKIINNLTGHDYYLDIDIERDKIEILKQYAVQKRDNSFVFQKPLGAKKWDYTKNGDIDLSLLPKTSKKKYWWKCPTCGNEWYGSLDNIVNSLTCNKCARQIKTKYDVAKEIYFTDEKMFRVLENSLLNQNFDLAKEWHPTKNGMFQPSHVTAKSGKRVWWLCPKCGNEWTQTIKTRNNGTSARKCPKCSNNQKKETAIRIEFNPSLYKEWHPTKNGDSKLVDYSPGSNIKVWWICQQCGLEYLCSIKYRQSGKGCPKCGKESAAKAKHKKIINLDTQEIFDSVKIAAQKYSIKNTSSISQCLSGKNKTAGGYRWKYFE